MYWKAPARHGPFILPLPPQICQETKHPVHLRTPSPFQQSLYLSISMSMPSDSLTCADVEPVGVVRGELLLGTSLDDVDPGGDLELTRTLKVAGVGLDELLSAVFGRCEGKQEKALVVFEVGAIIRPISRNGCQHNSTRISTQTTTTTTLHLQPTTPEPTPSLSLSQLKTSPESRSYSGCPQLPLSPRTQHASTTSVSIPTSLPSPSTLRRVVCALTTHEMSRTPGMIAVLKDGYSEFDDLVQRRREQPPARRRHDERKQKLLTPTDQDVLESRFPISPMVLGKHA